MKSSLKNNSSKSIKSAFQSSVSVPGKKSKPKRPSPISLRLSEAERNELTRLAGNKSLNGYIRERLFENSESLPKPRKRMPPQFTNASRRVRSSKTSV